MKRKKIIFLSIALIALAAVLCFCFLGADGGAMPYRVEKAYNVASYGNNVTEGQIIDGNTEITIDNRGYIMFLDTISKKRYLVNTPCKAKVKELIGKANKPQNVTKNYLEALFSQKQEKDKYSSAGRVCRGGDHEEVLTDSTSAEDVISVCYVVP